MCLKGWERNHRPKYKIHPRYPEDDFNNFLLSRTVTMPSLENLENELHVSKNVIKFLTQDLQAAQNEIRTLKVRRSNGIKP